VVLHFALLFVSSCTGPWPRECTLTFYGETFTAENNKARLVIHARQAQSSESGKDELQVAKQVQITDKDGDKRGKYCFVTHRQHLTGLVIYMNWQ
jgi:hypothetical protein